MGFVSGNHIPTRTLKYQYTSTDSTETADINPALDFTSFTISMCIQPIPGVAPLYNWTYAILSKGSPTNLTSDTPFFIESVNGYLYVHLFSGSSEVIYQSILPVLHTQERTTVILTYDYPNFFMYFDGVNVSFNVVSTPVSTLNNNNEPLLIGKALGYNNLTAYMYDFRIFNIAFNPVQVTELHNEIKYSGLPEGVTGTIITSFGSSVLNDIYTLKPDGSDQTPLVVPIPFTSVFEAIRFSPDGSKFCLVDSIIGSLYIYSSIGSLLRSYISNDCISADWLDNDNIIYARALGDPDGELRFIDINVNPSSSGLSDGSLLFDNGNDLTNSSFDKPFKISSNGSGKFVCSTLKTTSGASGHYTVTTYTYLGTTLLLKNTAIIETNTGGVAPGVYEVAISPDGMKLAVSSTSFDPSRNNYWITICDFDGSNAIYLLPQGDQDYHVETFSPDSSKLLYSTLSLSKQNLYIIDIDGLNSHNITLSNLYNFRYADWKS
jgi:hypothetical protein